MTGSLWVEEPVNTNGPRFCTVNHQVLASNYQLSNMKHPGWDSNQPPQRLKVSSLTTTPPSPPFLTGVTKLPLNGLVYIPFLFDPLCIWVRCCDSLSDWRTSLALATTRKTLYVQGSFLKCLKYLSQYSWDVQKYIQQTGDWMVRTDTHGGPSFNICFPDKDFFSGA